MITQNLFFLTLFILSLQFNQICYAKCPPSSCGLIRNISSPFRLKNCGDPGYELVCENNVTLMYIDSRKYYVRAIHYENFTMRLSDISTNDDDNNNNCSFPIHSTSDYNFDRSFDKRFRYGYNLISLVRCQRPLRNSSLFTQLTGCEQYSKYTYLNVGRLSVKDIGHMCTLDSVLATNWRFADLNNVSLSEIHQSLQYGFYLAWFGLLCRYNVEAIDPGKRYNCDYSDLYYKWGKIRSLVLQL